MTTSDQRVLLDTNVLVYAADTTAEFHGPSRQLQERALRGEVSLVVTPQILLEFFAVVTNPRRVANPRSPQEAREEIAKYVAATEIGKIYPHEDLMYRMLVLLRQYPQVTRQEIFDLSLLATMMSNGVSRIYTYNQQHFSGFEGIEVLTP